MVWSGVADIRLGSGIILSRVRILSEKTRVTKPFASPLVPSTTPRYCVSAGRVSTTNSNGEPYTSGPEAVSLMDTGPLLSSSAALPGRADAAEAATAGVTATPSVKTAAKNSERMRLAFICKTSCLQNFRQSFRILHGPGAPPQTRHSG